jgi:hypothetical protein
MNVGDVRCGDSVAIRKGHGITPDQRSHEGQDLTVVAIERVRDGDGSWYNVAFVECGEGHVLHVRPRHLRLCHVPVTAGEGG